jgi:hypothetical protein
MLAQKRCKINLLKVGADGIFVKLLRDMMQLGNAHLMLVWYEIYSIRFD